MRLRSTKLGSIRNTFHSGVLAACLLAGGLATNAPTARAADPVIKIGVLDEVKLGEGYTKYRSEMEDWDRRVKTAQAQVGARRFLNPAEGARFDELARKTARNAAEETDYQALVKVGTDRIARYNVLSGQATLSEDEKKIFKDMQDYQKANLKIANDLEDSSFQILRVEQEATDKKYIDTANAMVQKVAVDQKLTVLLRKDAIIWSTPTVDITDEVLKRLNLQ